MHDVIAQPANGPELRLPAVGFGTWPLNGQECRTAVEHALSIGYRHLDTARMYANEYEVGAAIADSGIDRDEITIVTKVRPGDADRQGVHREVGESLRELGVEHLDLLLLHAPSRVPIAETMEAFLELRDAGQVTHVGVSNFSVPAVEKAAEHAPIACVQNRYNPGENQQDVLDWCRANQVAFVAYSPMSVEPSQIDTLSAIGERHGKSWGQVAIRWLLQQGVAAIPRARSEAHRQQNLEVFDFELDEAAMAEITEFGRKR